MAAILYTAYGIHRLSVEVVYRKSLRMGCVNKLANNSTSSTPSYNSKMLDGVVVSKGGCFATSSQPDPDYYYYG